MQLAPQVNGNPLDASSPFQVSSLFGSGDSNSSSSSSDARAAAPSTAADAPPSSASFTVRVRRYDDGSEADVTLTAPRRELPRAVKARLDPSPQGPVGYLGLTSFTASAQREVAEALKRMEVGLLLRAGGLTCVCWAAARGRHAPLHIACSVGGPRGGREGGLLEVGACSVLAEAAIRPRAPCAAGRWRAELGAGPQGQ
jgi:hypothetical protein